MTAYDQEALEYVAGRADDMTRWSNGKLRTMIVISEPERDPEFHLAWLELYRRNALDECRDSSRYSSRTR